MQNILGDLITANHKVLSEGCESRNNHRYAIVDPEDKEFKETIRDARKRLETPVAPAMPCKITKGNQNLVDHGKN